MNCDFLLLFLIFREKKIKNSTVPIKADQLSESMTTPLMTTFPNSNSTRNQVDEEPLGGCATCKSLLLFIIYLFIIRRRWCQASTSKQTIQKLENGKDIEQGSSSAVSKKNGSYGRIYCP